MPKIFSFSEKETRKFGAEFAKKLIKNNGKTQIILLIGDLGSGKTAFVRGFAKVFNIKRALSPTFNIIKAYKINKKGYSCLFHADLYRIKNSKELDNLKFFQKLKEKNAIFLIEWPEQSNKKISGIKIHFFHRQQENERLISYN